METVGAQQGAIAKAQQGGFSNNDIKNAWDKIQSRYGEKPKEARKAKKQLDKDDFLRIMITQMQHQDPTKPFEADKLAQEIAQISTVEQLGNVHKALTKLETANRPLEKIGMTHLIGKTVTLDMNRFPHQKGETTNLNFVLPESAGEVNLTLISPTGETVFQRDLGMMEAGVNSYNWDGIKKNTIPADSGNYTMHIEAISKDGRPIKMQSKSKARVVGVAYQGNDPILIVGDGKNQSKVNFDSITHIEESMSRPVSQVPADPRVQIPAKQSKESTNAFEPVKNQNSPKLFSFKKGVGSKPLDMSKVAPDVKAAMNAFELDQKEKGFPNGLGNANETQSRKEVKPK